VSRRGFLPFSEGSRNCVGQALALVELKAVLALLLGNFAFRCVLPYVTYAARAAGC
jgi:cytochrome P450